MSAISTASEKARFHFQERELAYATGRYMRYPRLSHSFEVEDVCGIVRLNYAAASCSVMATPSSRPVSAFTRQAAIPPRRRVPTIQAIDGERTKLRRIAV